VERTLPVGEMIDAAVKGAAIEYHTYPVLK
jgi:hypothetical protein